MLILIGYAALVCIAGFFAVVGIGALYCTLMLKSGETLVLGIIMMILACGFGYASVINYPFNPITLKTGG